MEPKRNVSRAGFTHLTPDAANRSFRRCRHCPTQSPLDRGSFFLARIRCRKLARETEILARLSVERKRNATPAPIHVLVVISYEIKPVPSAAELEAKVNRAKSAAAWDLRNGRMIQSHEQSIVIDRKRIHVAR